MQKETLSNKNPIKCKCVCFIIYWFHVKSILKYCITYLHTQFVCLAKKQAKVVNQITLTATLDFVYDLTLSFCTYQSDWNSMTHAFWSSIFEVWQQLVSLTIHYCVLDLNFLNLLFLKNVVELVPELSYSPLLVLWSLPVSLLHIFCMLLGWALLHILMFSSAFSTSRTHSSFTSSSSNTTLPVFS